MTNDRVAVGGTEVSTANYINGRRVQSSSTFPTHSPATQQHLADVSRAGAAEVDAAVTAAADAFPTWAALGARERHEILSRFAQLILSNTERIAVVESLDSGMSLSALENHVVERSAHNIQFFADLALTINDRVIDSPAVANHIRYDPAGVSALITPWNAPFMLSTWKVGPCLAAGNTAVLKPPEWAPLSCSLMADLADEAGMPPGVFNVVQGIGEEAGAALVAHPQVRRISFTGSPETARIIGAAAAANLVPTSFELGGKSPNVIFADADLDIAVNHAAMAFGNAGQACVAGTRLLVEETIADEFQQRLRVRAAALVPGDPTDRATTLTPLIHPEHLQRVQGYVDRATQEGATIAWGGGVADYGPLYFNPTLVTDIKQGSEIEQQEVFGPVLTWQTFTTEDEAVELANSTRYGLSAQIFTQSEQRATRVARQIRSGSVWVNCFMLRELAAPFGGTGISGIGREGGEWSFDFYCDVKNIAVRKGIFGA